MMSEEELFKIDIDGDECDDETSSKKPDYYVDHFLLKDLGDEGLIEEDASNSPAATSAETCWNCGKPGHAIRDCTLPPNREKIKQAKKSFLKTQGSKRYHDNKFAKFRPGKYSSELREALGLRSNELPKHVYKMRILGYPPGWLADAKITNSGIKMYNSQGKRIREPDEEEGEIMNKYMKYDIEKIIEFPGFNVPLDRTYRDDSRSHGFPPMKTEHSIKQFIKHLEKLSSNVEEMSDNTTDDDSIDMDLSDMLPVEIIEEPSASSKKKKIDDIFLMETSRLSDSNSKSSLSTEDLEEGEITLRKDNTDKKLSDQIEDSPVTDVTENLSVKDEKSTGELEDGEITNSRDGLSTNDEKSSHLKDAENSNTNNQLEDVESNMIKNTLKKDEVSIEEHHDSEIQNSSNGTPKNEEKLSDDSFKTNDQLADGECVPIKDSTTNNTQSDIKDGEITSLSDNRKRSLMEKSSDDKTDTQLLLNKRKKSDQLPSEVEEEMKDTNNTDGVKMMKDEDSNDEVEIKKSHENEIGEEVEKQNENVDEYKNNSSCDIQTNSDQNQSLSSDSTSENKVADEKSDENETDLKVKDIENNKGFKNDMGETSGVCSDNTESSVSSSTGPVKRSAPIDIEKGGSLQSSPSSRLRSPDDSVASSSSFGTPNVKSHSPYSKLPSFENFNKDISDVIDFENLPDSVGKYETMCTIISRIRSFMSSKTPKNSKRK